MIHIDFFISLLKHSHTVALQWKKFAPPLFQSEEASAGSGTLEPIRQAPPLFFQEVETQPWAAFTTILPLFFFNKKNISAAA